jgi:hypothetical protein
MLFNATFNNISVISWQSVLLVEETRVTSENYWPAKGWIRSILPSHSIRSVSLKLSFNFECTDEGYSRNVSCTLNLIFTGDFFFFINIIQSWGEKKLHTKFQHSSLVKAIINFRLASRHHTFITIWFCNYFFLLSLVKANLYYWIIRIGIFWRTKFHNSATLKTKIVEIERYSTFINSKVV